MLFSFVFFSLYYLPSLKLIYSLGIDKICEMSTDLLREHLQSVAARLTEDKNAKSSSSGAKVFKSVKKSGDKLKSSKTENYIGS